MSDETPTIPLDELIEITKSAREHSEAWFASDITLWSIEVSLHELAAARARIIELEDKVDRLEMDLEAKGDY